MQETSAIQETWVSTWIGMISWEKEKATQFQYSCLIYSMIEEPGAYS